MLVFFFWRDRKFFKYMLLLDKLENKEMDVMYG